MEPELDPITVPGPPILSKSNPSQIKPLCQDGSITIFWSPPASDGGSPITGYTISLQGPIGDPVIVTIDGTGANIYTFSSLTNGYEYAITIAAVNLIGTGPNAAYRVVEPGLKPDPPTNAVLSIINSTSVNVAWSAPASDGDATIKWYVIKIFSSGDPVIRLSAHGSDRMKLITGLDSAKTYSFYVYAVNDPGYSPGVRALIASGSLYYTYTPYITDPPDPNYQYLLMNPGVNLGTGNFTIEFWLYVDSANHTRYFDNSHSEGIGILGAPYGTNTWFIHFFHWSAIIIQDTNTRSVGFNFTEDIQPDTWYYFAIQAEESNGTTNFTLWINGVKIETTQQVNTLEAPVDPITYIGYQSDNNRYIMGGYLGPMRVVVGGDPIYNSASATIPIPTSPFSLVTGTQLLLSFADENTFTVDESGTQTSITQVAAGSSGPITWNSFNPFS